MFKTNEIASRIVTDYLHSFSWEFDWKERFLSKEIWNSLPKRLEFQPPLWGEGITLSIWAAQLFQWMNQCTNAKQWPIVIVVSMNEIMNAL